MFFMFQLVWFLFFVFLSFVLLCEAFSFHVDYSSTNVYSPFTHSNNVLFLLKKTKNKKQKKKKKKKITDNASQRVNQMPYIETDQPNHILRETMIRHEFCKEMSVLNM